MALTHIYEAVDMGTYTPIDITDSIFFDKKFHMCRITAYFI